MAIPQRTLQELIHALDRAQGLDAILAAAHQGIASECGFSSIWLYRLDPNDPDAVEWLGSCGTYAEAIRAEPVQPPIGGLPLLKAALSANEPVLVADAASDPRIDPHLVAPLGLRTLAVTPVRTSKGPLGALYCAGFGQEGGRIPDAGQRAYLEVVASLLASRLERQHLQNLHRDAEQRLRLFSKAVELSPCAVVIADPQGKIEYLNPRFEMTSGYSPDELRGQSLEALQTQPGEGDFQTMWQTACAGEDWRGELSGRTKGGGLYWGHTTVAPIREGDGPISHFVVVQEDVTQRKDLERQILRHAQYDPLTQLPNRNLALDRLTQALELGHREWHGTAVMVVDLDRFRRMLDVVGHTGCDALIVQVAQRLSAVVREGDTVARTGGDAFMVVCPVIEHPAPEHLAQRILDALAPPLTWQGRTYPIGVSVGVAVAPEHGRDAESLIRNAGAALRRVKQRGGREFHLFDATLDQETLERIGLGERLRFALERGEIALHYQPVIDAAGRCVGAEALMRWNYGASGLTMPDRFIPLAEESGLIVPLGAWALMEACQQVRRWQEGGGTGLRVAVNISGGQFASEDLIEVVEQALAHSGIAPDQLELEITESLLIQDDVRAKNMLDTLKKMGVRLSLDDFGTGFSSLAYLSHYPFDVLKIDRSFTAQLEGDNPNRPLVAAIVAMGQALGLEVHAEGVETAPQRDWLLGKGCWFLQGVLYSQPLQEEPFGAWLAAHRTPS
ncbi:MAG: diguanylate cyclase [Alphaproteobacteria bacterium CG_4_10_14_0_2_um_filter_63_37]|nr:MAG: diguanylate cyclase [Alphaproteobacteria bacterium CG_4_10_14_0_2_um_filter_63_37]